jgi:hypothetical protein
MCNCCKITNEDILKIIKQEREYSEKISFILRHRNNLDAENPTFDEYNSKYAEMYKNVMSSYKTWLEMEIK